MDTIIVISWMVLYINISNQEIYVRDVISGYRFNQGHFYDKNKLEFFIKENSGIIGFYSIEYVLEILEST